MSWESKVKRVIAALCRESYLQANTNKRGMLYKRHRQYAVPEVALDLIRCLERQDEKRAKAIMLYDYDVKRTCYRDRSP